ncbi:MAG: mannose-6-phosphate isomerase-like protein (cupin superfamily), partial [Ulvibacter sp.]
MKTINIKEKFTTFSKHWHPNQIAIVDDMQVLLAKIKGDFMWHKHEDEDELFFVQKGTLEMHFRNKIEVV